MNTASLLRDWRYALLAIALLFVGNFAINAIGASADLAKMRVEANIAGVESPDLPSVFTEAVSRTTGSIYGLIDLFNIVAIVAVASLLAFHLMKFAFPNTLAKIGQAFDEGFEAMLPIERTRWKIGVWIVIVFAIVHGRSSADTLEISPDGRDLMIHFEVGDRSYYESRLISPTVPAWRTTASGVTVGFGIDVGHMSKDHIQRTFEGFIPQYQIDALKSVSGMKGSNAYYNGLPKVKHVVHVPWNVAVSIFETRTLPHYSQMASRAFNIDGNRLSPDENGALTSLILNRGASMSPSSMDDPPYFYANSRKEMRQIKYDIGRNFSGLVPGHIRSMKRLWSYSKLKGLHLRRDAEASLFAKGAAIRVQSKSL